MWCRCTGSNMFLRGHLLRYPLQLLGRRHFGDIRSKYIPFTEVINERRCQAQRSILVQVNSDLSFPELHSYCSQFGSILQVHHYTVPESQQHFMLVEFNNVEGASQITSSACFIDEFNVIPVQSSFMWFRPPPTNNKYNLGKKFNDIINSDATNTNLKLKEKNGCEVPKDSTLLNKLLIADDVSHQMTKLFELTHLKDLGIRLRYMVARQIECVFSGLYPGVKVHPFGSTVNSFGKMGCDLDLVMKFIPENSDDVLKSRLVFHTKKSVSSERVQQQRYMEIISDMLQLFVPGCSHVRRILQARIPIIKYKQDYGGLECDLSMNSLSGLYMSELLYLFGNFDSRVRPLVFTIRKWAQQVGLTNPSPGKWITNFPLTLMVLFFLQNANDGPIIPSFNYLKQSAGEEDVRITDDYVNCTFLRDIKKCNFVSNNEASLETLLMQFFEFYASFEYSIHAMSIIEGRAINKNDYSPLYIINPLEINLNVSKNVSYEECERLKIECQNAAWLLEENGQKRDDVWGLNVLFRKNNIVKHKKTTALRMFRVQDLFNKEDANENSSERIKADVVESQELREQIFQTETPNNIEYKNSKVEKEIESIKETTAESIRNSYRLMNSMTNKNSNIENTKRKFRRR